MRDKKFVFCEGQDDVAVVRGVAESIALTNIKVEPFLGKNQIREFLSRVRARPEFTQERVAALAVVRDADEDLAAAFASVRAALRANGWAPPGKNGEVVGTNPKVGILVIGPNDGKGMVEDLCLKSVENEPEFGCVEEYFGCIARRCPRCKFSAKAKVRVWMASQVDHELHVGKAAAAGYWPWASPVFEGMKSFLRAL